MDVAAIGEPLAGAGDGDDAGAQLRSRWLRRLEVGLVLLVLALALALAVAQVVRVSAAAGSRRGAVASLPVLVVDGGAGPAGVERVLDELRLAGIAARGATVPGDVTDVTQVFAPGAVDGEVAARVRQVLGLGTFPPLRQLQYGTGVTVVVGKDVFER